MTLPAFRAEAGVKEESEEQTTTMPNESADDIQPGR
jgi:hypothetical protein